MSTQNLRKQIQIQNKIIIENQLHLERLRNEIASKSPHKAFTKLSLPLISFGLAFFIGKRVKMQQMKKSIKPIFNYIKSILLAFTLRTLQLSWQSLWEKPSQKKLENYN